MNSGTRFNFEDVEEFTVSVCSLRLEPLSLKDLYAHSSSFASSFPQQTYLVLEIAYIDINLPEDERARGTTHLIYYFLFNLYVTSFKGHDENS